MKCRFLFRLAIVSMVLGCTVQTICACDQAPSIQAEDAGMSRQTLAKVHRLLEDHVARKRIAGAVALVLRRGRVAYEDAVGLRDVEANAPMTPDTIFRIASMTKPVTSTAIMILADQGKLALDDPVSQYLPEFKFPLVAVKRKDAQGKPLAGIRVEHYDVVPAYRPITIRDLLRHTSGLSYRFIGLPYFGSLYASADICDGLSTCDHSLAENVRRLAGIPLTHQPGTAW